MQESIGSKRTSDSLELSKPQPPAKKARVCFDSRKVSSVDTENKPKNNLLGMPELVLEKIFSYLPTHDLITCKCINQRICILIDDLNLLPLAYWKHTPPSVRDSYTKEQYMLRHLQYLLDSWDYSSVEKCQKMLETPAFFPQRLLFYMKGRLITANDFTCCKKTMYSGKSSERFYHIINEHSHCFLIEIYVKTDMSLNIVEIDIYENKTHTISYESKIIYTKICQNSGRIATLLKDDRKGHYVELHKLGAGKWISIFKRECLQSDINGASNSYELTRDHRCLAFKSDDKTISIWKENNKGEWLNQASIPSPDDIIKMKFSCDSNFLLILTNLQMQLWKIDDHGHYKECITEEYNDESYFFSEDDQFLMASSRGDLNSASTLRILALRGETICEYPCTPPPEHIKPNYKKVRIYPSPDSSTLILSMNYRAILIYEKNPVGNQYTLKNFVDDIEHMGIVFSQNGRFFSVCTDEDILEIWKKNNKGRWQLQMKVPHNGVIQPQFSGNSTCLVTVPPHSNRHTSYPINVLKLNREGEWTSKQIDEDFSVYEIEWLPDNNHFLTTHDNGNINRWTIEPVQDEASMEQGQD